MKQPIDLARRFLAVADRDIKTLHLLISSADSDDQVIGFHAQQAVEKCLKVVLAANQITFRKTQTGSGRPSQPSGFGLKLKLKPVSNAKSQKTKHKFNCADPPPALRQRRPPWPPLLT